MIAKTEPTFTGDRQQCVSSQAIAKCGRVLFAFTRFYLPFYGQDARYLFRHFKVFAWISAFVYDVDEEVELDQSVPDALARLDHLAEYLSQFIPLDQPIRQLFEDAHAYYRFENAVTRHGASYSLSDLVRMTQARSFDFRLLHRSLAHLEGAEREDLFIWFRAFEMLLEIDDDLFSFTEDLERRTFNSACLAVQLSPATGLAFVEGLRLDAEDELRRLAELLPEADRRLCESTVASYREIFPRPELPQVPLAVDSRRNFQ